MKRAESCVKAGCWVVEGFDSESGFVRESRSDIDWDKGKFGD